MRFSNVLDDFARACLLILSGIPECPLIYANTEHLPGKICMAQIVDFITTAHVKQVVGRLIDILKYL